MRTLGLDLKPARSGIAMDYDRITGEPRLSTAATEPDGKDLYDRVSHTEMAVMWRCHVHQPDVAFIEGTFSRGSASDYGQLAIHFAVTRMLRKLRIPWVDVQPNTLKVWACGKGNGSKDEVARALIEAYGRLVHLDPRDDDAADALALVTMARAAYGSPLAQVPERHRQALKTVRPKLPVLPGVA